MPRTSRHIFNGTFHDLDQQKCIDRYAVELNNGRSTLLLVGDRKNFHNPRTHEASAMAERRLRFRIQASTCVFRLGGARKTNSRDAHKTTIGQSLHSIGRILAGKPEAQSPILPSPSVSTSQSTLKPRCANSNPATQFPPANPSRARRPVSSTSSGQSA